MNYANTSTVEFNKAYTATTRPAIQREGEELLRTALETVQANTSAPQGEFNCSLEDDGSSVTVRASGSPRWVTMFAQIFKSVKQGGVREWRQINKKVQLFSSVGARYTNANVSEAHALSVDPNHQPSRVGEITQAASNYNRNAGSLAAVHSSMRSASKNVLHGLPYGPDIAAAFAVFQRNVDNPTLAVEEARAVYHGPDAELLPQRLVELYVEDELVTALVANITAPRQKTPDEIIGEAIGTYYRIGTPIFGTLMQETVIEAVERLYLKWENIRPKRGGRRKTTKKRRHR